jgi:hypothetical protein
MIKILHFLFWYVAAHIVVFGVIFLVAGVIRRATREKARLLTA